MSAQNSALLNQAQQFFAQGRVLDAKNNIDKLLMLAPNNVDVLNCALTIAMKMQNFTQADSYFSRLKEQSEDDNKIQRLAIDLLEAKEEHFQVIRLIEAYLQEHEHGHKYDLVMRFRYGLNLVKAGKILLAEKAFLTCQQQGYDNPFLLLNLGHVYKAKGKSDFAALNYKAFIKVMPNQCGVGYWSLADLKDYIFNENELDVISTLINSPEVTIGNLALLLFTQARAYEQAKQYSLAFVAMNKANDVIGKYRPFKAKQYTHLIENMIANVTSTVKSPSDDPIEKRNFTPIFIVGMPRSGTTLVEQIIASHSSVESTDELPYIERIALSLEQSGGYVQQVNTINPEKSDCLVQQYQQQVQQYFSEHQAIVIDKNPNNFLHIGLIKTLFPQAKIINVVRNPLDNAMSVYKQYFSHGHEYSYSLQNIALYWQHYLLLMQHWQAQFGDEILQLSYERLTKQPEQEIKRLLHYCELAFEPQCLTFHQSKRVVLTPSVNQVKQPINQRSVNAWKKYQSELESVLPLFENILLQANSLVHKA